MKKNNLIYIFLVIIIYLTASIYYRTGYFDYSIITKETKFYTKKDTIISNRFYIDLSGNIIILDKEKVILKQNIKSMVFKIED